MGCDWFRGRAGRGLVPGGDGLYQKDQEAVGWNLLFKFAWVVPRLNPLGQSHI